MNGEIQLAVAPRSGGEITVSENGQIINWKAAVDFALAAKNARQKIVENVLIAGEDFGEPYEGAGKNTLLLAGAQKVTDAFEAYPDIVILKEEERWDRNSPFFNYCYKVMLRKRGADQIISIGEGSANSFESKWYYRYARRQCPKCGQETIIKSKFGSEGWLCHEKKGGCGTKFSIHEVSIINQKLGRVPDEDIFDKVNTIRKMAIKRAYISAVMNLGFSEYFNNPKTKLAEEDGNSEQEKAQVMMTRLIGAEDGFEKLGEHNSFAAVLEEYNIKLGGNYPLRQLEETFDAVTAKYRDLIKLHIDVMLHNEDQLLQDGEVSAYRQQLKNASDDHKKVRDVYDRMKRIRTERVKTAAAKQ